MSGSQGTPTIDLSTSARTQPLRALLVEDDERFAALVQAMLAEAAPEVEVEHVPRISAALARLARQDFGVIVTDLTLPDSSGTETVRHLLRAAPGVPVVVLSGVSDIEVALDVIQEGADDFMVKGALDADAVARLVRVAALRGRRRQDAAAGVADHANLAVVGNHLIALADRLTLHVGVVIITVAPPPDAGPGLRRARMAQVSTVLRHTLRRCDVISRSGADELALSLVTKNTGMGTVITRVERALVDAGLGPAVSAGAAFHDPADPRSFEDLIADARAATRPLIAPTREGEP